MASVVFEHIYHQLVLFLNELTLRNALNPVLCNVHITQGMTCWQFDESSLTVLRQPTTCLQLFPNAPINMDSALRISSQPGFVFFFRGP